MGWNSWNSFATTITEAQALENARIMAQKLLPSGYDIFTVDIQWYEPNAKSYEYRKDAELTMDEYETIPIARSRGRASGVRSQTASRRSITWRCSTPRTRRWRSHSTCRV